MWVKSCLLEAVSPLLYYIVALTCGSPKHSHSFPLYPISLPSPFPYSFLHCLTLLPLLLPSLLHCLTFPYSFLHCLTLLPLLLSSLLHCLTLPLLLPSLPHPPPLCSFLHCHILLPLLLSSLPHCLTLPLLFPSLPHPPPPTPFFIASPSSTTPSVITSPSPYSFLHCLTLLLSSLLH